MKINAISFFVLFSGTALVLSWGEINRLSYWLSSALWLVSLKCAITN